MAKSTWTVLNPSNMEDQSGQKPKIKLRDSVNKSITCCAPAGEQGLSCKKKN